MTYYGSQQLAASFRQVRGNTIQIAEDIPENKYDFRPAPDTRSVAQLLAHIALASRWYMNRIDDWKTVDMSELVAKMEAEEAKARTKAELIALLREEGDKFASYLESLSEAFLSEQVPLPPGSTPATKSQFETMLSAKEHEMHHRGQLMLIERMLGIEPHLTRLMQQRMAQFQQAQR